MDMDMLREGKRERVRGPDEHDDAAAAFAAAIADVIAAAIAAGVRCFRRCGCCCCLQMLLLLLHHVADGVVPRATFVTFEATLRLPPDLPPLPETFIFSDSSSDIYLIPPKKLALAVAALMSYGVLPQKILASGKIYTNRASLGDSIALAAASQRVLLTLAVAEEAEHIPSCSGIQKRKF